MELINLEKFALVKQVVMPIVDGWGQIESRKIYKGVENGWYLVDLSGNASVLRSATPLEVSRALLNQKVTRVYTLGTEGIPVNFDNLLKQGLGEAIDINFLNLQPFEVAKAIRWEDKRWYFYEADSRFNRTLLSELRQRFNEDKPLDSIKDLTPELRYYWLLLNLQRQSYREFQELERLKLSQGERNKRIKEFQSSFTGRLQTVIEQAGGKLVKFYKYRTGYIVHWKIGSQVVKSTIRDNMRIINLGFCASGQDKRHSLSSAIQLAKMYGNLYITRE